MTTHIATAHSLQREAGLAAFSAGDRVQGGASGHLEAMRMETALASPIDGHVHELRAGSGDQVVPATALLMLGNDADAA